VKAFVAISAAVIVAAAFAADQTQAANYATNLAGTFRCGPDMKVCQWSGQSFTVTQNGNQLEIKNNKGDQGTAILTSNISVSAGPPWNMLGVISPDGKTISWSNGSEWRKS
jgi:hypothetical protein